MRRGIFIVGGIAIVLMVFVFLYRYAVGSPYLITAEEAQHRLKQKQFDVVLDVRTTVERNMLGYYPGSVHIQGADLEAEIPRRYVDKETRFLIYCNTGQRARAATEKLVALGYRNVRYIAGSYGGLLNS